MTSELDALLARPLPEVADDGFSASVARRALARDRRRKLLDQLVLLAIGATVLVSLPMAKLNAAIERVTFDLGSSAPVAVALAALALSGLFAQRFVDRVE